MGLFAGFAEDRPTLTETDTRNLRRRKFSVGPGIKSVNLVCYTFIETTSPASDVALRMSSGFMKNS